MNKLNKVFFISLTVLGFEIMQTSVANNSQMGRYLTATTKLLTAQIDLLSQTIQVRFPQNVQTIGDAMNYLLRFSGYSLVPSDRMNKAFKMTLAKPLPAIDRNFGPMSLKEALTTLMGQAFVLVQDPLNRTIDFRVKPQFAKLYADNFKVYKKS